MRDEFEEKVWPLLIKMFQIKLKEEEPIETLASNEKHSVLKVEVHRVQFLTNSRDTEHWVSKDVFEKGWRMLKKGGGNGTDFRGGEGTVNYVAKASFAYLPNVEYELGPHNKRRWYLVDKETHDLGTRKKH